MKTKTNHNKTSAQMLGLCLTALSAFSSFAQISSGWQTVLDYQYPGGTAEGHRIAADTSGNIFCGGDGSDAAGITRGMVLKTDTTQASWLVSDDSNPDPSQYESFVWNLGLDASGNVYSVGQLTPISSFLPSWYVRKRDAVSGTWSTVDNYQYAAGQFMNATGFTADDTGNIYVAGYGRETPKRRNQAGNLHWLVRKSTDGGAHWTLVDDVAGPTSNFGTRGAGFVPGAGIFVVGYPYGSSATSWLVRRSVSGEPGTWSTVDSPFAGGAEEISSDGAGNIYVVGSRYIQVTAKSGYQAWVTRKSSDGGSTWSTVDTFSYPSNKGTYANGIGRDADGNVMVVGRGLDAQGQFHWLVRTIVSGAWTTVDDFQFSSGKHSAASGVVTDAAGNLLVSGFGYDVAGSHWIVRRLALIP